MAVERQCIAVLYFLTYFKALCCVLWCIGSNFTHKYLPTNRMKIPNKFDIQFYPSYTSPKKGNVFSLVWIVVGCFLCLAYLTQQARAQDKPLSKDTTKSKIETIKIPKKRDIETTVLYFAEDSAITDVATKIIYLYGKAKIKYGDIDLAADFISFDQENNMLFATGKRDSLGRFRDVAKFKQGSDEYEADTMRYNFKTQKAVVIGIVTKQDEGFVTSQRAKKSATGEMYALNSHYTTCNRKHPHWYINASKLKMIPNKQVICGPFNLVIADIPTPLGFAFGMFPLSEKQKSGIVVPTYGEDADRGFFLRNGGYYWAVNDYMAADFLGGLYTNGSWSFTPTFAYLKRYRFTGNFNLSFNRNVGGDAFKSTKGSDFRVGWTHTPTPRGRSSFSANVNFSSNNFNRRNNTFNPQAQLSNTANSGVNYSTSFNIGKSQANVALSATQDQNTGTGVMNIQLPNLNFSLNRIYLFKREGSKAPDWLKNMNIQYTLTAGANYTNNYLTRGQSFGFRVSNIATSPVNVVQIDDPFQNNVVNTAPIPAFNLANLPEIMRNAQIGAIHSIPLSTTIKLLKHFRLSPSLSYREAWFPYKLDYAWEANKKGVRVDTSRGFHRAHSYSASATINTQIFGIFRFGKNSRIEAIRHTLAPSVSISFSPNQAGDKLGYFKNIQIDTTGKIQPVSRFQGFTPSAPIGLNQSGVINFDLQNIFEAKIRPKSDTGEVRKMKILDNLSINSSYNIFADTLKLSPIQVSARTNIFNLIDINFGSTFEPYSYEPTWIGENNKVLSQYKSRYFRWEKGGRDWLQLSNANLNFSLNLTPDGFKKKTAEKVANATKQLNAKNPNNIDQQRAKQELQNIKQNPEAYIDFDIPWTLNLSYLFTYNKQGYLDKSLSQMLSFGGDLKLSKTWKIAVTSGYDITNKGFVLTNIDIHKDLHCWEASFNWNPFGQFQSYSFDLKVKASMLQDLKVSKRRTWADRDVLSGR